MFEKLTSDLEAARNSLIEMGKAAIKPAILEFMAAHPEVVKLKWTSGTPSFNDGDPCEWSMHDPEVMLATSPALAATPESDDPDSEDEEDDYDDDEDEDDGDFVDSWGLPDDMPNRAELKADLQALYGVLQSCEDAVRSMFGDDVKVIIGRDGEATVSEYDIGY
jgi:hypothetical protein